MTEGFAQGAAALLGRQARGAVRLQGGDLSDVLRITLDDGASVVAKGGPDPVAEADMLRAIAAAGVPAPEVLAVDGTYLVLSDMPGGGLSAPAWCDLGACLARLHGATGAQYGWRSDYAFGAVAIRNAPLERWPDFYGTRRLAVFLPDLPADLARRVERLIARLDDHLPAHPAPSLLHGDLWTGNILADGARVAALIDPACYYGHGEVDLAMLCLFGQPAPVFWEAYGTPETGWPERRAVYQIWPGLVHLRLFGPGYRGLVERLLTQAGV